MNKLTSKKKQKLITEYNKSELNIGEYVYIKYNTLNKTNYPDKAKRLLCCKILTINEDNTISVKDDESYSGFAVKIKIEDIHSRYIRNIGENPFIDDNDKLRTINFSLESIINQLDLDHYEGKSIYNIKGIDILPLNWNPYVYNKEGIKEYYQRPFVWTKKDNQLLIESIYNGIECGRILIRLRSWKFVENQINKGETIVGFRDIVDGKQRLNAIHGFINNEFKDLHGNYYSDLSDSAQSQFGNHQLFSYAEMDESSTDEQVIQQFLKVNFSGKQQSEKHIEFVKSILNKI